MRINEVDKPLTQGDIDQLERFADRLFAKVGIDVEFTRHFLDRVNDERNVRQITMSELTRLFKQEFKRWGKKIAQMGPDAEAVMKDLSTDVNMPFALRWDQNNQELDLVAKTVMRKQDFKTSNPEFAVESVDPILTFIQDKEKSYELSYGNCGVLAIALDQKFDMDEFIYVTNDAEPDKLYHVAAVKNGKIYDADGITNISNVRARGLEDEYPDEEPQVDHVPAVETEYNYILKGTDPDIGTEDLIEGQHIRAYSDKGLERFIALMNKEGDLPVNKDQIAKAKDELARRRRARKPIAAEDADVAGAVMRFGQFSPEELKQMAIVLGVSITVLKTMFATYSGIQKIKKAITSIGKKKKKSRFAFGESTLTEGGAMPGVGAIHIDEIEPTLIKLEKSTGLNMRDFVLGSVGKRQFSGDIDIAINLKPEQLKDFAEKLEKDPNFEAVTKSSVFMTKVKIENYDPEKSDGRPRTGYVQVDFMPGDPGWMKTYYHSPREEESKYKGVFRNIMIATISAVYNRQDSQKTTEDGRPLESERYMFSPRDGLVRIKRTPVPTTNGEGYTKKNKNVIIEGPWRTANEIAEVLNLGSAENLNSFETLHDALKKYHTPEVYAQVVKGFKENPTVQDIGIPEELK